MGCGLAMGAASQAAVGAYSTREGIATHAAPPSWDVPKYSLVIDINFKI
jgi:hypothetical protein